MKRAWKFAVKLSLIVLIAPMLVFAASGRVHGKVTDPSGKPIEKVKLLIELVGEVSQKYHAETNSKGEYIHIGIPPGNYKITPSKEGYAPVDYSYAEVKVGLSDRGTAADFKMQPEAAAVQQAEQPPLQPELVETQLGIDLLKEGKIDEGIASLKKALEKDPNIFSAHYNLGVAYQQKDQPEEARKAFREAILARPDQGDAYLALAQSYMIAREFGSEPVDALLKAGELMPDNYNVFYNLGSCYANTGKHAESEKAFRRATEINPKEPVAHYQLAMALLGQSKNAEAKAEFLKYLELNPNAADRKDVEDLLGSL